MRREIKKRLAVAGLSACALFGGIAAVSSVMHTAPQKSPVYQVNDSGETYGSASIAQTPDQEPDLIAALATNGKQGYVRKTDLDAAEGAASSPEEAVQQQKAHDASFAEKLIARIDQLVAAGHVGSEIAGEMAGYVMAKGGQLPAEAFDLILENPSLEQAYRETVDELSTPIPVYDVDGKTVIGEFLVG